MSTRNYDKINPVNPLKAILETGRTFDIRDEKWAHPALRTFWDYSSVATSGVLSDPDVPLEVKQQKAVEAAEGLVALLGGNKGESDVVMTSYVVPGCPEEPEAEVEVRVFRSKNLKKKKARVLFYLLGGGLVVRETEAFPIEEFCERYNCVIVVPMYRRSWEAPYPAQTNDMHAAYQWMVENAEMLQINPDNVVISGISSGGHLATILPFRLKRYGFISPRGVVAISPQTDEREKGTVANYIYDGCWGACDQRNGLAQYLGRNYGSFRVGPEALANHATVEDCIGYPPLFIHTSEFDPDRDNSKEFHSKVADAKSYCEFHTWGGAHHSSQVWDGAARAGDLNEYSERVKVIVDGNIEDCFKYDLRRPWVLEEK